MCGICGVVDFSTPPDPDRINSMVSALHHRGPDGQGVYVNGPVGLGHARLSIIDLSETGAQPMISPDSSVALTYNGELYNYRELRTELEQVGHRFVGQSDSEVLLASYLEWGVKAFARFNGIFAAGIWDSRNHELVLVRDRFGVKPLYVHRNGQRTVFGSEIKALLASKYVESTLDYAAMHEFLFFRSPLGERTMFADVSSVPPGSYVRISADAEHTHRYWEPDTDLLDIGEAEAVAELRARLERGVEAQLVSDVPVGVFLSGGIDSSCIAAFAARHSAGTIKTFSVGFDFSRGPNELPAAKAFAEELGTDHHELHVKGFELGSVLEELVRAHDHPFSDPANVPLYLLCRELGGDPKVILQGDGGDEIFAGYPRYSLLRSGLLTSPLARVAGPISKLVPRSGRLRRAGRVLEVLGQADPGIRAGMFLSSESPSKPPTRILQPDVRRRCQSSDPFVNYVEQDRRFSDLDPVQRMLFTDTQILLPNIYLEKVDRPTMAHSMEVRVPMLDNEIVDFALRLPTDLKIQQGSKKHLLRSALRGVVPDRILDAPKTGFSVPESYWLQTSLSGYIREVLFDRSSVSSALLDRTVLEPMVDAHIAGQTGNGPLLWNALHLALWAEQYKPQL